MQTSDACCECPDTEWAINPVRECTRCRLFIDFEGVTDFLEWSKSMRVDRREQILQEFADAAE